MIDLMVGRTGLAILAALTLGACASGSMAVNQEVSLRATEGGERVEAACEASNDKATWTVVAPAVFGVTRSDTPLTVECRTPEGGKAVRVFDAVRDGGMPGGVGASYSYPPTLDMVLRHQDWSQPGRAAAAPFASVDDLDRLPKMGDEGLEGYRRFLAGESPRAFALSDTGRWVRVNAVRGAARLALERCQTYGGRCRLYAVDNAVVWDPKRAGDVLAAY